MTSNAAPEVWNTAAAGRRRGPERRRVLLAGKIVQADGAVSDCAIRNLSEQGAQIRVAAGRSIPNEFYLIEMGRGAAHRAQVAWRQDTLAGLIFWDRIDLNDARVNLVVRLRDVWLSSAAK